MSDARSHGHKNDRNANTHHHRSREGIRRELSPHTHSVCARLVIHCVSRRTERPTTSSRSSTKLDGIPWMASQAIARVRSLSERRWQSLTWVARDVSPWYAACSRVGSLYKRPVRCRFTVMDDSKTSEGIFRGAPVYSWELWANICTQERFAEEICVISTYVCKLLTPLTYIHIISYLFFRYFSLFIFA